MHSKDTIRVSGHCLYIQYGATGERQSVSAVRLDQGVTFSKEGDTINARYHHAAASLPIERFASDALAANAYRHLQRMIERHARHRRIALACKGVLLWGALPATGLMFMLVLNLALSRVTGSAQAAAPFIADAIAAPAAMANAPQPAPPDASELARAMSDGAKAGKFSVAYSRGARGTLYVFSDPSCPSCRALEHEMVKLANDYTIHVFPVSVIGGAPSARRIGKLMCAPADARAPIWKMLMAGADLKVEECRDGAAAVSANDQIFRAMRFEGTPAIINASGDKFPDASPNTAAAIQAWMRARGAHP
ncbi:TrbB protein [Oxalobacteraceae bacterium GrIS 1.11]